MRRVLSIFCTLIMMTGLASCEKPMVTDTSQIDGIWESTDNGMTQSLMFFEKTVEYACQTEYYNTEVTYFGTYYIVEDTIFINLDSLMTKRVSSPKVEYIAPENMPKEPVLINPLTIIYLDCTFLKRVK